MGEVYRILYKSKDSSDNKTGSLILKMAPTDLVRRKEVKTHESFIREITMYDEVYNDGYLINFAIFHHDELILMDFLSQKLDLNLGLIIFP